MQLDDLLQRYFATTDLSGVASDTWSAGIEHCRVDLGLEQDRGKRPERRTTILDYARDTEEP